MSLAENMVKYAFFISLVKSGRNNGLLGAETYDAVSGTQEKWAKTIIDTRKWTGKENVLDAGCGSGRVTRILSKVITKGKIYAIDNDSNMVKKAKENLLGIENVKVMKADLLDIGASFIPLKIDVVFSNAVLHWISDHRQVFRNFNDLLNGNGVLLIQCWGYGNLQRAIEIFDKAKALPEFRKYFTGWKNEGNFANPRIQKTSLRNWGTEKPMFTLRIPLLHLTAKATILFT